MVFTKKFAFDFTPALFNFRPDFKPVNIVFFLQHNRKKNMLKVSFEARLISREILNGIKRMKKKE